MSSVSFKVNGGSLADVFNVKVYHSINNPTLVEEFPNVANDTTIQFTTPFTGVYEIRVVDINNTSCIKNTYVEVFFPVVTYSITDVDCTDNTFSLVFVLTNPGSAGETVEYGWSFTNSLESVSNWQIGSTLKVPADDIIRYFFVRNESCGFFQLGASHTPCTQCNIVISNIVYSCDNA